MRNLWKSISRADKITACLVIVMLAISSICMVKYYAEQSDVQQSVRAQEADAADEVLHVHVKGCVAAPDVYTVTGKQRVNDLIALAGGLTDDADTASLNLAAYVTDGMEITVPSAVKNPSSATGKINVNTATKEELIRLPGIGEVYAQRIIDYRTQNGMFHSAYDLTAIKGIGTKTVQKFADMVEF